MVIASGELARRAGVSPDTLRHYERVGVLAKPARSANNYRIYPEAALDRVLLIRRALGFGFSLVELAVVLRERDRGGLPCRKVRALAALKLASTETRLAELTNLRDDLRLLLENWDRQLDAAPPGKQVHLLDSLSVKSNTATTKETVHESSRFASRNRPRSLAGPWSHESSNQRTPTPGRPKR
ncbi:MAG: MerR family DNA-binding transcriptional regulator [Vicinamibacteria bacterium]|nr:MerR family DNA-binding transcriptional regulator [Vicinamibacteria bacterium]